MILNILISHETEPDKVAPASELRLEADSFLIKSAHITYGLTKRNNEEVAICQEADIMAVDTPPKKLPFWIVSHKDKVYCFQTAFLTNSEGKTIQRYG